MTDIFGTSYVKPTNILIATMDPVLQSQLVIIHDEDLPRGLWKLCKIEEVISGRDVVQC